MAQGNVQMAHAFIGESGHGAASDELAGTEPQISENGARYRRWSYFVFAIGVAAWNLFFILFWYSMFEDSDSKDTSVTNLFLCGFVSCLITFLWLILDSTVYCCNPGPAIPVKLCCCRCLNPYAMLFPMAIAALVRCILWCSLFIQINDVLSDANMTAFSDNVCWVLLSIGTFDTAPLILICVDWFIYYRKRDFEGIFGYKRQPWRVAFAQSIVLLIISWSFVAALSEVIIAEAEDPITYIWPWILHGLVSAIILVLTLVGHSAKLLEGNAAKSAMIQRVYIAAGAVQVIMIVVIAYKMFRLLAEGLGTADEYDGALIFVWSVFMLYYIALTAPVVWGLFSVKKPAPIGQVPVIAEYHLNK